MILRALRSTLAGALCAGLSLAAAQTVVKDPYYGDALFHLYQDDSFGALTGLMVSQHFERVAHHADEAELLRGGLLLSYGLHREAGAVFARLIGADGHAPASESVRDRAWYGLARIRYRRGLFADAERALARIAQPLPGALEDERELLAAQLRLAQGDAAGAAALLAPLAAGPGAGQPPRWVARFNLGVALVRSGEAARGQALLAEVGSAPAATEEQRSLRDRANVALGFAALQEHQPERARVALQRVRLGGAESNKALLAFGWAADAMHQPRAALVPWAELAAREATQGGDSAVLEARLARPYALAELGASGQALAGYTDAVAAFERERAQLAESIAAVGQGALVDALLRLNPGERLGASAGIRDLPLGPRMPHADHLTALFAGHEFQEAFKNLRDLQFLQRNLADWQDKLGSFDDMLANRARAFAERLPAVRERAGALSLASLQQRRDALAAELAGIDLGRDAANFADAREAGQRRRVDEVRAALPALAADARADAQERLRRVAGALTWQPAVEAPARRWNAAKGLREADQALARARAGDAALARAQVDEPARLQRFAERIAALAARLDALTPRVAALGAEQQQALQALAVAELAQRQQRLTDYSAQARLAIAQLQDRALQAPGHDDAR